MITPAELAFHKYEGTGNDFVLVESTSPDVIDPARAKALCDRHFGIGADGVLLVLPPVTPGSHARMRVLNADGSVPEMCGNGLRCAVLHVARALGRSDLRVDTDAGPKRCSIDGGGLITVDMGTIEVFGEATLEGYPFVFANAGNPHAITLREASREEIERVGPRVETNSGFPRGTNVEFARFSATGVDLLVWERGCGITQACGTGACATVAVGVAKGLVAPGVETAVRLPGGTLHIAVDASRRAIMRGPARHVFSGTIAFGEAR